MPTASDFRTKAAQLETPALALYQQVKDYIARKIQDGPRTLGEMFRNLLDQT